MPAILPHIIPTGRYTFTEVREILNISRSTFWRYVRDGYLVVSEHQLTKTKYVLGSDLLTFWKGKVNPPRAMKTFFLKFQLWSATAGAVAMAISAICTPALADSLVKVLLGGVCLYMACIAAAELRDMRRGL